MTLLQLGGSCSLTAAPHHPSAGQVTGQHHVQGGSHHREAGSPPDDGRWSSPPAAPPASSSSRLFRWPAPQLYVRAMVNYNPQQDPTIPCADAGVGFRKGDILEIVDQTDALWWQARKLPSHACCAGLVPSSSLLQRCGLPPPTRRVPDLFQTLTQSSPWPTGSRGSCGGRSLTCLTPACISVSPAPLLLLTCQSQS